MAKDYEGIQIQLKILLECIAHLKRLGMLNTKKDFTSQIGEWLVAELYDAKIAANSIQKDWDMIAPEGQKIQVKTHAKSATNKNRWTGLNYRADAEIGILIIIVFSEDYKIKEFYYVPWKKAFNLSNQNKTRRLIRWNHLAAFNISPSDLPKQDVVNLFL